MTMISSRSDGTKSRAKSSYDEIIGLPDMSDLRRLTTFWRSDPGVHQSDPASDLQREFNEE